MLRNGIVFFVLVSLINFFVKIWTARVWLNLGHQSFQLSSFYISIVVSTFKNCRQRAGLYAGWEFIAGQTRKVRPLVDLNIELTKKKLLRKGPVHIAAIYYQRSVVHLPNINFWVHIRSCSHIHHIYFVGQVVIVYSEFVNILAFWHCSFTSPNTVFFVIFYGVLFPLCKFSH